MFTLGENYHVLFTLYIGRIIQSYIRRLINIDVFQNPFNIRYFVNTLGLQQRKNSLPKYKRKGEIIYSDKRPESPAVTVRENNKAVLQQIVLD